MRSATVQRARIPEAPRRRSIRTPATAVAATTAAVLATSVWGRWLQANGHHLFVNLPPLVGHLDPRFAPVGVAAPLLGLGAVVYGPALAARLPWRRLLAVTLLVAAAWATSLALTEGVHGLIRGPSSPQDYLHDAPLIRSPSTFLRTYIDDIDRYSVHVRAHPPGMALIAWSLSRVGGGPGWLAALEILVGASAVPAVLIAVRDTSGEDRARAVAPYLAFAPLAVSIASSGDALFAGVGAWAVTLVVLATGRRDRRGDLLSLGGGLLLGVTAFLSYGLVLLWIIPLAVAGARRRARPIVLATIGAVPVVLAFSAAGFWWFAGLLATRVEYLEGVARSRPYGYFLVANIAALAVIVGPATVAGLASPSRWPRTTWALVGGALAAAALADLSGMSKAEVERIWLPFAVWAVVATGALPGPSRRRWLAANVGVALLLEVLVSQPW